MLGLRVFLDEIRVGFVVPADDEIRRMIVPLGDTAVVICEVVQRGSCIQVGLFITPVILLGLELKTHRIQEIADDRPVNIDVAPVFKEQEHLLGTVRT